MSHIRVTLISVAPVKMIRREFCSLMSLQMQKLVSKETTLTSLVWFLSAHLRKSSEQNTSGSLAHMLTCMPPLHRTSTHLQKLLTAADTLTGTFEERSPRDRGLGLADIAAHPVPVLDDS